MVKRNTHFAKLQAGYLFPEIEKRKQAFLKKNPAAKIISLGIGNTTIPLSHHLAGSLEAYARGLATLEG